MKKKLWGLVACFVLFGTAFAAMRDFDFMELCAEGSPQQISNAIKGGADVNAMGEYGETPLMFAATSNSNPKVITTLVKAGADMNAMAHGETPLMCAAKYNSNPDVITAFMTINLSQAGVINSL